MRCLEEWQGKFSEIANQPHEDTDISIITLDWTSFSDKIFFWQCHYHGLFIKKSEDVTLLRDFFEKIIAPFSFCFTITLEVDASNIAVEVGTFVCFVTDCNLVAILKKSHLTSKQKYNTELLLPKKEKDCNNNHRHLLTVLWTKQWFMSTVRQWVRHSSNNDGDVSETIFSSAVNSR